MSHTFCQDVWGPLKLQNNTNVDDIGCFTFGVPTYLIWFDLIWFDLIQHIIKQKREIAHKKFSNKKKKKKIEIIKIHAYRKTSKDNMTRITFEA